MENSVEKTHLLRSKGGSAHLSGLGRRPPGWLLHRVFPRLLLLLLGHGAVQGRLADGGSGRGPRRRGGRRRTQAGADDRHVFGGRQVDTAQGVMGLRVHHQQPGPVVHGFDPLHHLIAWQTL